MVKMQTMEKNQMIEKNQTIDKMKTMDKDLTMDKKRLPLTQTITTKKLCGGQHSERCK